MRVSNFPRLSFFSHYSSYQNVSFSYSLSVSFITKLQVLLWAFLVFNVFQCFLPYSMSYNVFSSFHTFFSVYCRISYPTLWDSPFPCLSVFSPYSRFYSVYVSFYRFFSFLAIIQVLPCTLFIFHVFSIFRNILGHTILCLIFHVFQFSHHNLGPIVRISHV